MTDFSRSAAQIGIELMAEIAIHHVGAVLCAITWRAEYSARLSDILEPSTSAPTT
ncbi:MAG: hypothetical protein WB762_20780 [Candidatus Sulfotelmatobacter sp.]